MAGNHRCVDRFEISDLVHRYCDALCERDIDAWVGTWARDGVWNVGRGPVAGHGELSLAFRRIMALFDHVIQLTHNGEVAVAGDGAKGRWYVTEYGLTAKGRKTFYIGHYDDQYRRTPDGWRFDRRIVTWHYHGEPDLGGVFGPPEGYET